MAIPNPDPQPDDLFEPGSLDAELLTLLGPRLHDVLLAARSGDRDRLHEAERGWALAVVAALDIDISLSGLDRIKPNEQYIVAPLHDGFADVLALLRLPLDLNWVIRDELLALPYFGEYLRTAGHIAVDPESPRAAMRGVLRKAGESLARGESLVIFPQGSLLGVEVAFRSGAFRLAERLDLPVLPVVLTGSHLVWDYPFDRAVRRGQSIRLEVLDPVEPAIALATMREIERDMKKRALAVGDARVRRYVPERDGTWDGYSFELDPEF